MDEQEPAVQIDEQIFAAPPGAQDFASLQGIRRTAERPAQWPAKPDVPDCRSRDLAINAEAGDFYFGEFRHG
jgi:hypothetical protein